MEAKNERLEDEKKRLSDDMWENYEITYPEALKIELDGESPSDIKRRAGELKAEIKALGSFNVNAVDDY